MDTDSSRPSGSVRLYLGHVELVRVQGTASASSPRHVLDEWCAPAIWRGLQGRCLGWAERQEAADGRACQHGRLKPGLR